MSKMYEINTFLQVVDDALDDLIANETSFERKRGMMIAKDCLKKYRIVEVKASDLIDTGNEKINKI